MLHDAGNPEIRLAPFYDVLSTTALQLTDAAGQPQRADTHLGQRVGGETDVRKVTSASLVEEAVTWGLRKRTAGAVVADTLDRILAASREVPGDERVIGVIAEQAERVRRG